MEIFLSVHWSESLRERHLFALLIFLYFSPVMLFKQWLRELLSTQSSPSQMPQRFHIREWIFHICVSNRLELYITACHFKLLASTLNTFYNFRSDIADIKYTCMSSLRLVTFMASIPPTFGNIFVRSNFCVSISSNFHDSMFIFLYSF